MTNTTKRIIFFQKFALFTAIAKAYGIDFLVTCFYRDAKEQKARFDEGKSMCDGYKTKSAHQKWLAIDIVIINKGELIWGRTSEYDKLGQAWKDMGGTWGGDWTTLNDIYHFQSGDY